MASSDSVLTASNTATLHDTVLLMAWTYRGYADMMQRHYDGAEHAYLKADSLAVSAGSDRHHAELRLKIGALYSHLGENSSAIEAYLTALEYYESRREVEVKKTVECYLGLAILFADEFQQDKLFYYLRKSVALARYLEEADAGTEAMTYAMAAQHYTALKSPEALDTTLWLCNMAEEISLRLDLKDRLASVYNARSIVHYLRSEHDQAIDWANQALQLEITLRPDILFILYKTLALSHAKLNQIELALRYQDSVESWFEKDEKTVVRQLDFWGHSKSLYLLVGDYESAYRCAENEAIWSDSVNQIERFNAINNLEEAYQSEARLKEIQQLKQKQLVQQQAHRLSELEKERTIGLIVGIGCVVLLLTLLLILVFRQRWLAARHKQLISQQRLLRAQLNPHFFFNSLGSIQQFSLEKGSGAETARYIARFASLMRQTLESSFNEFVTIEEECELLENYVKLQQMRGGRNFNFEITHEGVDIDEISIPSMITQPFIENSIEHGFCGIDYQGALRIDFRLETTNALCITIEDNGRGISSEAENEDGHVSRSTAITEERLHLLYPDNRSDLSVNSSGEKGTSVKIVLPIDADSRID